ncbi:hypothetical protein BH10BAC3_BH10BAC3_33960 [soil metagenome]
MGEAFEPLPVRSNSIAEAGKIVTQSLNNQEIAVDGYEPYKHETDADYEDKYYSGLYDCD